MTIEVSGYLGHGLSCLIFVIDHTDDCSLARFNYEMVVFISYIAEREMTANYFIFFGRLKEPSLNIL